jgi:IS5 family transposase
MKFFKAQYCLDFEQPVWDKDLALLALDHLLDDQPHLILIAAPCFPKAKSEAQSRVGRDGMTLEQVVRAAIYQRHNNLTFRELSKHTADSKMARAFLKLDYFQDFSYQALQENISQLDAETLEKMHIALIQYALKLGVDKGQKQRTDSTVIRTNIHHPTNAALLWDGLRVSYRLLTEIQAFLPRFQVRNYRRAAKKLYFKIVNTTGREKRRPLFKRLLQLLQRCQTQLEQAQTLLSQQVYVAKSTREQQGQQLLAGCQHLLPKLARVYAMADRREIQGAEVPVAEKIFSIFEDHTDCIVKGQRNAQFGHKINFTSGQSGLIFDCIQKLGNPPDTSYFPETLDRLQVNFQLTPRSIAADGGYASQDNHKIAQRQGVVNIVFNKVRGVMQNTATSLNMETRLKKWRAGMEAIISNFKRGLNAATCPWKGWDGFKSYVLWGVITFNLHIIAKWLLAKLT